MLSVKIDKIVLYFLLFFLLFSNLIYIPEIINTIIRYMFIFLGVLYLVYQKKKLSLSKYNIIIYIYMFFSLISIIFSPYFNVSLILSYLQFAIFYLIIINIDYISNLDELFHTFFRYLRKLIFFANIYSLFLIFFGTHIYENGTRINYLFSSYIYQSVHGISIIDFGYSSFFNNPNIYGFYCLIYLCYLLFVNDFKTTRDKIFAYISCFIGISLANSRAVIMLSCVLLCIYLFYYLKPIIRYMLIPIIMIFVIIVMFFILSNNVLDYDALFTGRIEMWEKMLNSIREYPILGVGFSASTKYIVGQIDHIYGSHNSYLNILAENGFIGFFIFIFALLYIIKVSLRTLKLKKQYITGYLLFSISYVLISIPYSFFENVYMVLDLRNTIWMICCIYIVKRLNRLNFIKE